MTDAIAGRALPGATNRTQALVRAHELGLV